MSENGYKWQEKQIDVVNLFFLSFITIFRHFLANKQTRLTYIWALYDFRCIPAANFHSIHHSGFRWLCRGAVADASAESGAQAAGAEPGAHRDCAEADGAAQWKVSCCSPDTSLMVLPSISYPLALSFAAREPLDRFQSSWYFWKAEIKGYPMVYNTY